MKTCGSACLHKAVLSIRIRLCFVANVILACLVVTTSVAIFKSISLYFNFYIWINPQKLHYYYLLYIYIFNFALALTGCCSISVPHMQVPRSVHVASHQSLISCKKQSLASDATTHNSISLPEILLEHMANSTAPANFCDSLLRPLKKLYCLNET